MFAFILNIPYSIIGVLFTILSVPKSISFYSKPLAVVIRVHSMWWTVGYMKGARAVTIGHLILLSPTTEAGDLEHELVHVEQHQRAPLIYPFLYYRELMKRGYRKNKYEEEAYQRAGNLYREKD